MVDSALSTVISISSTAVVLVETPVKYITTKTGGRRVGSSTMLSAASAQYTIGSGSISPDAVTGTRHVASELERFASRSFAGMPGTIVSITVDSCRGLYTL